jgi:hypothetical protein
VVGNSGGQSTIDCGVAPAAGTAQRFVVEWHGSATPWGQQTIEGGGSNTSKVRYFINGTRVATHISTDHLPSGAFSPAFTGKATGAATGIGYVGPLLLNWNALQTPDVL